MVAAVKPIRNVWSKNGLDLSSSAFSKIYQTETSFSEKDDSGSSLKKFELTSDRFEELRTLLTLKQDRMAMQKLLKITQGGEDFQLLDQPQLITKATMIANRDTIWNVAIDVDAQSQEDVNTIFDKQLKCHAFGLWISNALTNRAIQKFECSKSEWTVEQDSETYIHGPLLFWYIVDAVKPNNDTLVQQSKDKLSSLNVKDFEQSAKDMLTEFENICTEIEVRLKGTVTEDEKISALWKCLETMKDEHFSRVVSDEKRAYRRELAANRMKHDALIELFKREQTDLEADGKWNRPNQKSQIMALTSMLQSVVQQVNNVASSGYNGKGNSDKEKNLDGKAKSDSNKSKYVVPDWKYQRKDDETTCNRDGKDFWWCDKHTNPATGAKGMWARHKPEDHSDVFVPSQSTQEGPKKKKKKQKKKKEDSSTSDATVTVDKHLLTALKTGADVQSFLDQLQDQNGTSLN